MKSLTMRMYRRLASAFPHEFQIVYGPEVVQLGEQAIDDIWRQHGIWGFVRLLADIAIRVPAEYLTEMRSDLSYAVRTLSKSRGFAIVGIASLGLGIGASAFTAGEYFDMILRDVPGAADADKLFMVQTTSYPYFEHYRDDQRNLFAGAAAFNIAVPFNVSLPGANAKADRVFGQLVSPEYFSVLGVAAARGRTFDPHLDKPGAPPVVFVTDRFWRNRMGADPDAVGRSIRINGQPAVIAGIGPKDFSGIAPYIRAEIFVPTTVPAAMAPELAGDVVHKRDAKQFGVLLRLAPGVTEKAAEAGLDAFTRNLDQETLDPERNAKGRRVALLPAGKVLPIPRELMPLFIAVTVLLDGIIVAIACMNLANMQLARAAARRREVAIRLSVGASRFRLIRQLLTESVLLAMCGGAAGIAFAFWAANAMKHVRMPFAFPIDLNFAPDWHALVFTFLVALAAGIGFGLAPALATTRTDLVSTLKEGAVAQARGYRRYGMRNLLMAFQVAGSLTLLLVAGFLIVGFKLANNINIPFDGNAMYLLSLDPVRDGYTPEQAADLLDKLPDRLLRAPGVQRVVLTDIAPYSPHMATHTLTAPGEPGAPEQVVSAVAKEIIGGAYFAALDVSMLEGREFDARDQRLDASNGTPLPVVLNETAAHAFFGSRDPLGRRVVEASRSYVVAGVVKDLPAPLSQSSKGGAAGGQAIFPVLYLPLTRADFAQPPTGGMIVMVRFARAGGSMEGLRREMASLDPNLAMFNVHTLADSVDQSMASVRLNTTIYGAIGSFGLVLSAIGLAGVTAYSVTRRRKEIGIRVALGARKSQVLWLVMREGGALVIVGTVLGLGGGLAFARVLQAASSAFGSSIDAGIHDTRLLVAAPLLLAALAMLACYLPARRSAKIDPLIALREE